MRFVGRGLPAQAGFSHDIKTIAVSVPIARFIRAK
jgi:hypothetical protein